MLGLALLGSPPDQGILITRCASIHTIGMRFAIDLAFLSWPPDGADRALTRVLHVRGGVGPFRLAACPRRSRAGRGREVAALELAAGRAQELGLVAGAELAVV